MNAINKNASHLMLLLQGEIRHTRNLIETLEQESEALVTRDVSRLENITGIKLEQLRQLESIGKQREVALKGIDGDPLNDDPQLSALWQELMTLATQCAEQNRINGSVIDVNFRQSQQALDILQGKSGKAELYDQSGQTAAGTRLNTLAQA